jgi:tRNA(Arg) A34 adenosine deaminase TadA
MGKKVAQRSGRLTRLSASDYGWIARAIKSAQQSTHRVRVGASVVVAGRGHSAPNKFRNSAHIDWTQSTTHAEEAAIARAYRGGSGGTIFVARIGKAGDLRASHPCERCMPQIIKAGIKRVVYYDGNSWISYKIML